MEMMDFEPDAEPEPVPEDVEFDDGLDDGLEADDFEGDNDGLEDEDVLKCVSNYLHLNDFKTLRQLNSNFNQLIVKNENFVKKNVGIISSKFYSTARGVNRSNIILWKYFKLNHFTYHRNLDLFKVFWRNIGSSIKYLTLSNSSFECDGFAHILNGVPTCNSLVLSSVKLRDLDNYHNPIILAAGNLAPPNYCRPNISPQLKHLAIDNVNYVENCFWEYLINRTGHLESFALTNCFHPTTSNPYVHLQRPRRVRQATRDVNEPAVTPEAVSDVVEKTKLNSLFNLFKYYFKILLYNNGPSIKKLTLFNNNRTHEILPIISSITSFGLTELNTDFRVEHKQGLLFGSTDVDHVPLIISLIEASCVNTLEKLSLDLHKQITNNQLHDILNLVARNIKEFKLCYNSADLKTEAHRLDLNNLYNLMPKLEKLEIQDKTLLTRQKIEPLLKKGGTGLTDEAKNQLIGEIESKVDLNFVNNFPINLREVKLDRIVSGNNYLSLEDELQQARLVASLSQLSTFVLKGPWIHSIDSTLSMIFQHMRQLNNLSLVNCNLTDSLLTGLDYNAVYNLGKCNLFLMPFYTQQGPAGQVYEFMNPIVDENGIEKPYLGHMTELKSLDLSQNFGVTNVTLGHSLSRLRKLVSLNVSSCPRINDLGLELIGYNGRKLVEVNLKHIRRISKIGLNQLINICKSLKRLYVTRKVANKQFGLGANGQPIIQIQVNPQYNEIIEVSDDKDPLGDSVVDDAEDGDN